MKEKGKNAAECDKLAKTSLSACPREWVRNYFVVEYLCVVWIDEGVFTFVCAD